MRQGVTLFGPHDIEIFLAIALIAAIAFLGGKITRLQYRIEKQAIIIKTIRK